MCAELLPAKVRVQTGETWAILTSAANPMAEVKELSLRREGEKVRQEKIEEDVPNDLGPRSFTRKTATRTECLPALGGVSQMSLEARKRQRCGYRMRELLDPVLDSQRVF